MPFTTLNRVFICYYERKLRYKSKTQVVIANSLRKEEKDSKDAEAQVEEEAEEDEIQEVSL